MKRFAITCFCWCLIASPAFGRKHRFLPSVPAAPTATTAAVEKPKWADPQPVLPPNATTAQRALYHEKMGDWHYGRYGTLEELVLAEVEYAKAVELEPTRRHCYWHGVTTTDRALRRRYRDMLLNGEHDTYWLSARDGMLRD